MTSHKKLQREAAFRRLAGFSVARVEFRQKTATPAASPRRLPGILRSSPPFGRRKSMPGRATASQRRRAAELSSGAAGPSAGISRPGEGRGGELTKDVGLGEASAERAALFGGCARGARRLRRRERRMPEFYAKIPNVIRRRRSLLPALRPPAASGAFPSRLGYAGRPADGGLSFVVVLWLPHFSALAGEYVTQAEKIYLRCQNGHFEVLPDLVERLKFVILYNKIHQM